MRYSLYMRMMSKFQLLNTFTVYSIDSRVDVPLILLRIARQNECGKRMVFVNIKKVI